LTAVPQLYERTVTINGCSKAYAMTGWRIGYCGGPKEIVTAMATVQGQSTTNAASMCQKAAIVALSGDQQCVAEMSASFRQRHDFVVAGLNDLPGITCRPGSGTFYAFADVRAAMQARGFKDDVAFCEYLLADALVAVVPGSGFGSPGHMRISFACSLETLGKALDRMRKALM
jgi:aspartate aminotransferase